MSEMRRILAPLYRSIGNRIQRAVVLLANDSLKMQRLQVAILADESKDSVEHFQPFGFTAHPVPGAEAIVLRLGIGADHAVIIAVDDRRYRKTDLGEGESAQYDAFGKFIHLTKDGGIIIDAAGADVTVNNAATITMNASVEVVINAPTLTVNGDIEASGNITTSGGDIAATSGEVTAGAIGVTTHHHHESGGGNTGAALA